MEDKQKEDKIRNLLSSMRRKNIITTDSSNKQISSWIFVSKFKQEGQDLRKRLHKKLKQEAQRYEQVVLWCMRKNYHIQLQLNEIFEKLNYYDHKSLVRAKFILR